MKLFQGSAEANFLLDCFSASIEPLFRIEADNNLAPICEKTGLLADCMDKDHLTLRTEIVFYPQFNHLFPERLPTNAQQSGRLHFLAL